MVSIWKIQIHIHKQRNANKSKRKTFNACIIPVMTYGCETWTLTKTIVHKLQVA